MVCILYLLIVIGGGMHPSSLNTIATENQISHLGQKNNSRIEYSICYF